MTLEEERFGNYFTYIGKPDNFEQLAPNSLPVLIFLHGQGEVGGDPARVINSGGSNPIQEVSKDTFKDIATGEDWPMIVTAPHALANWSGNGLGRAVDDITANADKYKIDVDRIYVTGLSLGGIAISSSMAQAPSHTWYRVIAGAYPLGGSNIRYDNEAGNNAIARNISFRGFYGEFDLADYVGDPNSGKSMVQNFNVIDAIESGYYDLKVVPGGGHNAVTWGAVYKNHDKESEYNIYGEVIGSEPPIIIPPEPDNKLYVHDALGNLKYTMIPE